MGLVSLYPELLKFIIQTVILSNVEQKHLLGNLTHQDICMYCAHIHRKPRTKQNVSIILDTINVLT